VSMTCDVCGKTLSNDSTAWENKESECMHVCIDCYCSDVHKDYKQIVVAEVVAEEEARREEEHARKNEEERVERCNAFNVPETTTWQVLHEMALQEKLRNRVPVFDDAVALSRDFQGVSDDVVDRVKTHILEALIRPENRANTTVLLRRPCLFPDKTRLRLEAEFRMPDFEAIMLMVLEADGEVHVMGESA